MPMIMTMIMSMIMLMTMIVVSRCVVVTVRVSTVAVPIVSAMQHPHEIQVAPQSKERCQQHDKWVIYLI